MLEQVPGAAAKGGISVGTSWGARRLPLGLIPTTPNAADQTRESVDAFVTRLTGDGSALVYSTFWGGRSVDDGQGTVLDPPDRVYVTGGMLSPDFPTTPGAFDNTNQGFDGYVTKFNLPSGPGGTGTSSAPAGR